MKYFVESYGCTMNYGEGDDLAERMLALGYSEADSAEDADIIILNTCTVIEITEKKMIKRMNELRALDKEVIVTGCMAKVQASRINVRLPGSLVIPPENYKSFSHEVAERYGYGTPILPKKNRTSAIIPVAQGCRGNCTYCITKFARGTLKSYDPVALKKRFDSLIEFGVKEILLTAQDTGCYGIDIGTNLGTLVRSMLEKKGEYRIRIGMTNPNSLRSVIDPILDLFNDERVYRFLHIPVQSGSDAVLDRMKRHYTSEKFFSLVNGIRAKWPDISIATDLIAGFPGETDKDHALSCDLIRELKADTVNITRFSARPGTEAFSMPQLNGRISKKRSAELTAIKNDTERDNNSNMVGKTYRCLVTEISQDGSRIARTENYRPIAIQEQIPMGTFVNIEVTDYKSTYLIGRLYGRL